MKSINKKPANIKPSDIKIKKDKGSVDEAPNVLIYGNLTIKDGETGKILLNKRI
jgi:hypothetical protein